MSFGVVGRDCYQSLFNTDMERKLDHLHPCDYMDDYHVNLNLTLNATMALFLVTASLGIWHISFEQPSLGATRSSITTDKEHIPKSSPLQGLIKNGLELVPQPAYSQGKTQIASDAQTE